MRYLLLSSLFFFLFAACTSSKKLVTRKKTTTPIATFEYVDSNNHQIISVRQHFWTDELLDKTKKNDFRISISTPKANITGIFIVKQIDGKWRGSIINEFGIKVLDFESSAEKCKLMNVISFIDKGYIKKVIASDIQFIMEIDNPNYSLHTKTKKYWSKDIWIVNYKNMKELRRISNDLVEYENVLRKLKYSLVKINENP
jgi:hypothetical protein